MLEVPFAPCHLGFHPNPVRYHRRLSAEKNRMMKYEVFNILILYERCTIIFFNQFEYLLPPHLPPSFWSNVLEGEEENFYTPVLRLFKTLILDNILKKTVHMLETLLYKWKRTLSVYMTLQIAETAERSVKNSENS